jgi:hypothetical protein
MKAVDTTKLSKNECWGIQINGLNHCQKINCKWQGLSACEGREIIRTGRNALGHKIGATGLVAHNGIIAVKM